MKSACRPPAINILRGARHTSRLLLSLLLAPVLLSRADAVAETTNAPAAKGPDFNLVIRPILSENCYKCHGPDEGARKSELRFDERAKALQPAKSGKIAIVLPCFRYEQACSMASLARSVPRWTGI